VEDEMASRRNDLWLFNFFTGLQVWWLQEVNWPWTTRNQAED